MDLAPARSMVKNSGVGLYGTLTCLNVFIAAKDTESTKVVKFVTIRYAIYWLKASEVNHSSYEHGNMTSYVI